MIADNKPRALVMGLGKSGFSSLRYLLAQGYEVEVFDTREQPPLLAQLRSSFPEVSFSTGTAGQEFIRSFDLVVSSPGLSIRQGAIARFIADGGEVVGDVELFARDARAPIVAITGANGKSTVTMLVGHILASFMKVGVGGNIGTPVLDLLDQPVPDIYVLELSSFQLETTHSLNARAATVINITEDHMDRYDDIADYAECKQRIFRGNGTMVLNRDDPMVSAMKLPARRILWFSANPPVANDEFGIGEQDGEPWLMQGQRALLPASEIPLAGRHNQVNVLVALALISDFALPMEQVRAAIRSFEGLPHRCEVIAELDGVQWINDSKATNVGATAAALAGIGRPVVLIAGGEGKDADFKLLAEPVSAVAHSVILIGRDAGLIKRALAGAADIRHARSLEQAVTMARELARPGDAVLLSPACASFDMFDNFEHRGQTFAALVQQLVGNTSETGE